MPELHTVWAAHEVVNERGGYGQRLGVYSTEELARIAAKGHGFWGGDGKVKKLQSLLIEEDGAAYYFILERPDGQGVLLSDEQAMKDLKARALGKLDETERRLLGV